ncbi:MAG: acyl-CoA dehydrogenase family protein [Acidobacteriota bacterium]
MENIINAEFRPCFALARDFAKKELADKSLMECRCSAEWQAEIIMKAGNLGFYEIVVPEEHGGMGAGIEVLSQVMLNISMVDASMAGVIFTNAAAINIVAEAAIDTDCDSIRDQLTQTRLPVAFPSFSRPDDSEMPIADLKGGVFRLNGALSNLVLGDVAEYAIVPAKLQEGEDFSYYLVKLEVPHCQMQSIITMGFQSCPVADVILKDAPAMLVGVKDKGWLYFQAMQNTMSVAATAISVGIMKGSFNKAVDYANERYQGGRLIIEWPEVRMILSGIASKIALGETALSFLYTETDRRSQRYARYARATAIHLGQLACSAATDGVQLLGGYGYMHGFGQEERMRDATQARCLLGMVALRKLELLGLMVL